MKASRRDWVTPDGGGDSSVVSRESWCGCPLVPGPQETGLPSLAMWGGEQASFLEVGVTRGAAVLDSTLDPWVPAQPPIH